MHRTIDSLPSYLRKYCVEQNGDKYTAREHAAWRYIMRQSRAYFREHAVSIYLEGLKRTGITLDRIPLIDEIDLHLQKLGWGAVPVCGFIPPAAFLDFQARRILPIASDMRSVEHIGYTPAPDIVHEAAGHAPILADKDYSDYLTMYAAMAQKAIFAQEDLDLYEAIRVLSDTKENPDSTPAMIAAAEARLDAAQANVSFVSEANKVARMNWWTVEYGLLGDLENPKIYGAGLLSSVGESQSCLSDKVRKIPLTIDCVNTTYNITEPQPQLFVAEDIRHLSSVLREFEATLAFRRGGTYGLEQAKQGRTVTTTVLDSGLEISGKLVHYELNSQQQPAFIRWEGPSQLAYDGAELPQQGVKQHPHGFSSPLGRFKAASHRNPHELSDADLAKMQLERGKRCTLEFLSGFVVEGIVRSWQRQSGQLQLISWQDCRVTRGMEEFFKPEWGDFDMAVGTLVVSVYGGPSDREAYGSHDVGRASTTPGRSSPFTPEELKAFAAYAEIRQRRQDTQSGSTNLKPSAAIELVEETARHFRDEWLLRLEALELAHASAAPLAILTQLEYGLRKDVEQASSDVRWLVHQGLELIAVRDA